MEDGGWGDDALSVRLGVGGGAGEGLVGVRARGVGMMVGGTEFVIWGIEGVEGWKWGHGMEEMGVVYPG